jgi:uncharacterized protein (TIGR02246 family)
MSLTRLGHVFATFALALLCVMSPTAEAQQSMVDGGINDLVGSLASAWNHGDAVAFARSFRFDGTFTNVNGTTFEGHDAFEQRHREIFAGPLKGSTTKMGVHRAQLIRPDVAVVDVECVTTVPSGQTIESKLLLVLAKEQGAWMIAAFHNTGVQATPVVR